MIDYLADLLEEETAVDLEGQPWPVTGRRRMLPDEDEGGLPPADWEETLLPGPGAGHPPEDGGEGDGASGGPFWGEALRAGGSGAADLVRLLRQSGRAARLARLGRGEIPLTLPEPPVLPSAPDLLEMDRAVQRDARRYDGDFPLY